MAAVTAASFPPLLLLLLLLSLRSSSAQINVTLGSSLSTNGSNSSWPSPSGDFAFGFHRLPNTVTFLLAVWFQKVPNNTLVWYTNETNPVQPGSNLHLTADGSLVLRDPRGGEAWRASPPFSTTVASAAMLDTGSFALLGPDYNVVWDTFGYPADTILPSQVVPLGSQLSSHLTDTNYSPGRFMLRVRHDGNVALYPVDLLTRAYIESSYWSTDTTGSGQQLVFNDSTGYIYLTRKNDSSFSISTQNLNMRSPEDYYHRATLDSDGGFRHYIYPKNGSGAASWTVVKSIPDNLCTNLTTKLGGGICGYNSLCRLNFGKPNCTCLPGFSYVDPAIPGLGCKPNFDPQSCGSDLEIGMFELEEMVDVNWPQGDFEQHVNLNEGQCKEDCLNDCYCALAVFRGGTCWKKGLPMLNGRAEVGSKVLLKLPTANFSSRGAGKETGRSKEDRGPLVVVGSLLGVSGFLNLAFFLAAVMVYFCSVKNPSSRAAAAAPDSGVRGTSLRSFTYKELVQVTNGFKEELGTGAFGTVYKGTVRSSDSAKPVAAKKLNRVVKDGEKEFIAEVSTIGRTHHKNLVQLLGFCQEGSNRLLVYEFMSNGSLADFLFRGPRPDWNLRMQIACGIARGMTYLHEDCESQIIHCDIKPHNILLDENLTARIADFGLAKLMKTDHSRTYTSIRGTRGYVAPEWFRNAAVSAKVDVYSFGVMLLEIICCRKNVDMEAGSESKVILTDWAYDCYKEGKLVVLVEGDEEALRDQQRLERAVIVAICCIQEDPAVRPSMKTVTQMLEGTIQVYVPPSPSSFRSGYSDV